MQSLPIQSIQTAPCRVRTIRRKAEWQALLLEYAASNLSQKNFCELHQLSMSSFYQWKKKLSDHVPEQTNFIDISPEVKDTPLTQAKAENAVPYQIELELGFGMILRVRSA